ncbi:hypothetical protein [Zooshikella ganghwensis]|uniref:Phosphatase PAP2 family protein n=1 Tax=Zooshikella ganghwensis TaxID=202772 RepID=A0A4P9VI69_9GAMM|nr:hypothetical protein [Zooshikella ganghwensis]RDH42064.1 hypothetical protein B9G39_00630 [Zooshikella ganghwensis]
MSYEILDTIADLYIPLLACILFCTLILSVNKDSKEVKVLKKVVFYFIALTITSYGVMFLDNTFKIWPHLMLDYSTHTAVSFTLVLSLYQLFPQRWLLLLLSFILYLALMVYQQYHSIADILTTLLPIGLLAAIFHKSIFTKT